MQVIFFGKSDPAVQLLTNPGCFSIGVIAPGFGHGQLFFAGAFKGELDYPVSGGVTVQRVASDPVDTIQYAAQLLTELKYEGNAGVDFRYDAKTRISRSTARN